MRFSPPKGIRCFSITRTQRSGRHRPFLVSVPRRGFVVFLLVRTYLEVCGRIQYQVSVPRRGFVVFLLDFEPTIVVGRMPASFQSPEGDSWFFYDFRYIGAYEGVLYEFQSPEGDSLFFYRGQPPWAGAAEMKFQSPEGDSLFFYTPTATPTPTRTEGFSPPKGIHCFSTSNC